MANITYLKNEALPIILEGWKGNPVINGRFVDPNKPFSSTFKKVLKWQLSKKEKAEEKKNDKWRLTVRKSTDFLKQQNDAIVWLGHASFFIQVRGVRILTDPVFGRISGVVPRLSELPCSAEDFTDIDYVLLSHAHRDHCDAASLKKIFRQNPSATLLTSLNTGKLVAKWIEGVQFIEAGWYQQFPLSQQNIRITFLPSQHWSNRYLWDINTTLYGSFMIEADGINIFFGGDSGYAFYPKQIGGLFPQIDIAVIGVGAYTPSFMMRDVHTNPFEAVDVFHDLKAKALLPMHYGTFDLADEPLGEPYRILKELEAQQKIAGELLMPDVGELLML